MAILCGLSFLASLLICRIITTKSRRPWTYVIVYTLLAFVAVATVPEPSAVSYLEDKDARIAHSVMLVCAMFTTLVGVLFGVVVESAPGNLDVVAK